MVPTLVENLVFLFAKFIIEFTIIIMFGTLAYRPSYCLKKSSIPLVHILKGSKQ